MSGSTHNATHVRKSSLWSKLKTGKLMNTPICQVEGRKVIPYLLGDSAYPIRPWLLKPHNNKKTGSASQNRFDQKWKAGRVKIENAFGMLKNKFQILKELNVALPYAAHTVTACCALQQFLHRYMRY